MVIKEHSLEPATLIPLAIKAQEQGKNKILLRNRRVFRSEIVHYCVHLPFSPGISRSR